MKRTHVLTGAGSGIGAAIAEALHARGDHLILLARDDARAADLERRFAGAEIVVVDLADPSAVERLSGVPDAVDSLLLVAAELSLAPVDDLPLDDLQRQLNTNLVAPTLLTKACLSALRRARGSVVFMNSSAAITPSPTNGAYAASKSGLHAMADSLRRAEMENGVRVTSMFLSRTATPMQEKVHAQEGRAYDPARWIQPETVARTVLHVLDLSSDATIADIVIGPGAGVPSP